MSREFVKELASFVVMSSLFIGGGYGGWRAGCAISDNSLASLKERQNYTPTSFDTKMGHAVWGGFGAILGVGMLPGLGFIVGEFFVDRRYRRKQTSSPSTGYVSFSSTSDRDEPHERDPCKDDVGPFGPGGLRY